MPNQRNKNKFLQFTSIPFEMFIIIFLGYKLGAWLDTKYPNEFYLYTLISTLLSVVIAMVYIIRRVQKISQ
ncbi:MAG TPA: AtpZ/AtpI family protein [Flavobacteriales bacterium]|nr:AtpZ/AtpI family protein [Flavobacteriales bacterium]